MNQLHAKLCAEGIWEYKDGKIYTLLSKSLQSNGGERDILNEYVIESKSHGIRTVFYFFLKKFVLKYC